MINPVSAVRTLNFIGQFKKLIIFKHNFWCSRDQHHWLFVNPYKNDPFTQYFIPIMNNLVIHGINRISATGGKSSWKLNGSWTELNRGVKTYRGVGYLVFLRVQSVFSIFRGLDYIHYFRKGVGGLHSLLAMVLLHPYPCSCFELC